MKTQKQKPSMPTMAYQLVVPVELWQEIKLLYVLRREKNASLRAMIQGILQREVDVAHRKQELPLRK